MRVKLGFPEPKSEPKSEPKPKSIPKSIPKPKPKPKPEPKPQGSLLSRGARVARLRHGMMLVQQDVLKDVLAVALLHLQCLKQLY